MKTCLLLALTLVLGACVGPARSPAPESPVAACSPALEATEQPQEKAPEKAPRKFTRRVVVTTGVHGNEPSGYLVQETLSADGFVVFGPCNPWGIQNNKREMEDGRDLNRLFGDATVAQVKAVHDFLSANRPDLLLDLHEDPTGAKGPYLIQNGPKSDIGRRIIEALRDEYAWDPAPAWGPVKGEDGLIKPTSQMLAWQKSFKVYSLAAYAYFEYGVPTLTVEVPGEWDMERKKAYQLKVCRVARELIESGP
ncbi:MAG: hypothetical protein HPKKFMNG_00654 [Planctomycetes bacterium]|nr:hypothetical protein [Planctomycetota bacterium]HRJ79985.1 succinylglutamate desuccinylase/aspartoacylase family protein [Planctomycetota bacterium]